MKKYALALFAPLEFEVDPSAYRGRFDRRYIYPFFGTQCMYYSREGAHELRGIVKAKGVDVFTGSYDLLVGHFYGDRKYACN